MGKKKSNDRVEKSSSKKEDKNNDDKECPMLLPKAFFQIKSSQNHHNLERGTNGVVPYRL